jgi:flagellar assembly protein FliH
LDELLRVEVEHHAETERHALTLMATAARKVLPDLSRRNALGEIEHLARELLDRLRHESRVTIRTHPDLAEALRPRVEEVKAELGAKCEVTVLGDADVINGDCQLEWGDGGAERRVETLLDEIDAIVARNLEGGSRDSAYADETPRADECETPGDDRAPESTVAELRQAQATLAQLSNSRASQGEEKPSDRPVQSAVEGPEDGGDKGPADTAPADPANPNDA